IVEALEAVATDAAALAVELFAFVQRVGVLGDHVGRVALLAARVEIRAIVKRPEPVFVPPVPARDGIEGASIAAVARRATELLKRVNLQKVGIGMAGVRRIVALRHAEIGFGYRQAHWN